MPYYVHDKERPIRGIPTYFEHGDILCYEGYCSLGVDGESATPWRAFDTRADAHKYYLSLAPSIKARATVDFRPTPRERDTWMQREQARFNSGEYIHTPWSDMLDDPADYPYSHWAHLSLTEPGQIAYTPDAEHGIQDRQIRTTAGRYLKKFYPNMSASEIQMWSERCKAERYTLQLARTAADITAVYDGGPDSCMGGSEHRGQWNPHPCTVYAEPSDLAVAYYGDMNEASQRCVVWPDRKLYGRIYNSGPLRAILEKAGYTAAPNHKMNGAKILRLSGSRRGRYLMPYIDGAYFAHEVYGSNQFFKLHDDVPEYGNYIEAQSTSGESVMTTVEDDEWTCSSCDGTFSGDDGSFEGPNGSLCESCYEEACSHCRECDEVWIERVVFSYADRLQRQRDGVSGYCRYCARRILDARQAAAAVQQQQETTALDLPWCSPLEPPGNGGALRDALSTGVWSYTLTSTHCLIRACRAPLAAGSLVLHVTTSDHAYCPACANARRGEYTVPDYPESAPLTRTLPTEETHAF